MSKRKQHELENDPNLNQEEMMEGDTAPQPDAAGGSPAAPPEEAAGAAPLDPMEQLQQDYANVNDRLLRTLAEYDNYRKRTQRERDAIYPDAVAATVAKFLPLLDNFQRAAATPCADENYKKGVEMILVNFQELLAQMGIEAIGEAGESFSPSIHNAVLHVEDESQPDNTVVEVLQPGYRMGDRILRAAMVKVAN